MKYEEALEKLDIIIEKLESKNTALDEGIQLYQQGLELTDVCLKALAEAKGKITVIKKELNHLIEKPFGEEE